jgi:hypothetical protein
MSFCLIDRFLRCIFLALGANFIWGTSLPSGPNGERTPFRFLECDVQGGDANEIKGADAALALINSQLPFVSGIDPDEIVSFSWPPNMEAQDLFPKTSSTYTFPTGIKVDVACFSQTNVVDIERTECPDPFVNPIDPSDARPCVKVLNGSTVVVSIACFSHSPCLALHTQPCPVAAYSDEEYGQMWAGSNAVGLIGLVLNVYMCMTWSDQYRIYCCSPSLLCMYHSFSYYPLGHFCLV